MNIQKEIQIHHQLKNSQIINFLGNFKEGRFIYLVLELFEGPNLFSLMKKRDLKVEEIQSIFKQVV